ncbi:transposase [Candidatus Enterovibrio escicola]|uniref:transposase n=1 Tax=Candidatus Enterovibrio escicola TaxID=1927127 RepID=UPI001237B895|nr:transposase [Candidatus Enterovibrio escacola]
MSAKSISQFKQKWEAKYDQWRKQYLSKRRYVYSLADGIYCKVRMDKKLCLLVVIGVNDAGHKEVRAVVDRYRELKSSWLQVL